nr:MAG TPA: Putative virion structural protein [Caudoviricetes sp.]
MNALQYTWNKIFSVGIPREVLELAFPAKAKGTPLTLEERILTAFVRPVVLTDMNLLGGVMMYISVSDCSIIALNDYGFGMNGSFIIEVPKKLLSGGNEDRYIIYPYNLVMGQMYGTTYTSFPRCMPSTLADTTKIGLGINPTDVVQTSRLEMVGENKVLVEGYPPGIMSAVLCCNVSNNANLENVQPPYYHAVYNLIEAGIKMYIYNTLRVKLDSGYLYAGHEIPAIKEIVDSYSDMADIYQELLRKWAKTAVLTDSRKHTALLALQIGMMA